MTFKAKIERLVEKRKDGFKADNNLLASNYGTEKETAKEYNGRQLLELLQNADDAQSDTVLIRHDKRNKILSVSNKGGRCEPFSVDGVRSIMYANLSSKISNQYIGNKGLGFRSIINWADEITIHSNGIRLSFSETITEKHYEELTTEKQRRKTQQDRNLADGEIPMAILAIPEIQEVSNNDWTTTISIKYKEKFLDEIKNQIEEIKAAVLLFLNNLQKIETCIDDDCETIVKPDNKDWKIEETSDEVPSKFLDENENSQYELKIAYNKALDNENNSFLFAYFPTKIKIDLPFIVHGTFELGSARNRLIENRKNKFIVEKLVEFIVKTALSLKQNEANYQALEFLYYEHKNEDLEDLKFYKTIDKVIEEKEIYPCIDNKYSKKEGIVYCNDFAKFIQENNFIDDIPYLLKPTNDNQELLEKLKLNDFDTINKKDIKKVNQKIDKNTVRAEFIYHLVENKYAEKLPLLTDKSNQLISLDDDIYTPSNQDFSLPDYVHIQFINPNLYELLKGKFGSDLVDKLKDITNLKLHNKVEILRKVITSTNTEIKKENAKQEDLIKKMIECLYCNYDNNTAILDQNIQLLDQNQQLKNAKNLYLSKTYPSGELTEELFGDIFAADVFLADIDIFGLGDDKQKIEDFFWWLGVNKHTKFSKETKIHSSKYGYYIKSEYLKSNAWISQTEQDVISNFDEIKNISKEKFITWCLESDVKNKIKNDETLCCEGERGGYRDSIKNVENYILFQLKGANIFKDYLIGDDKLNKLVTNQPIDYSNSLFEQYSIHKSDIDSLLLKLGAVEKFSELSFDKIKKVLQSLPEKHSQEKLAQKIYIESFKKHEEGDLNSDIRLFAEQDKTKHYFPQDEVYYAGSVKLPKEYTNTLAIFDYPKKKNVADIVKFFGINDLSKILPNIKDTTLSSINDKFQSHFQKIKPYILAYRVENLDKKDGEAKKLNNLKIDIYKNITCKIDNKEYELPDYDYLIDDKRYLIKVPNKELKSIRSEYDFYTVFGNIIGLIFDVENTDKFKNCIKDYESNIKKDIEEHIGNHAINDAMELLGIASDFYNFWHTIYERIGKEYTNKHNNNLELINQEIGLDIENEQIEYDDLSDLSNAETVIEIFKKLGIEIADFNNAQANQINLSGYHQQKLEECFNDKQYQFKQNLYQNCIDQSQQEEFLTKLNQYKAPITNHTEALKVNYQNECEKFIHETFGFEVKKVEPIDFYEIFSENKKQLGNDFEHVENNNDIRSLLYYKDCIEVVKKHIDKDKHKQQEKDNKPNQNTIKKIKPAKFITPSPSPISGNSTHDPQSHLQQNKQRKEAGNKAEQAVYDSLIEEYGKKNVDWMSNCKPNANYDFRYYDGNKRWFVEVKTLSNEVFYISKNERKFAEKNKDSYKIFLVGDEIKEICPVDFNDDKFIIEAENFSIRYQLNQ